MSLAFRGKQSVRCTWKEVTPCSVCGTPGLTKDSFEGQIIGGFFHSVTRLRTGGWHWMNSIIHTVISSWRCRDRGGSRMGVQLYHSAPSKSRCESEAVQEYSPQDTHNLTTGHVPLCWHAVMTLSLHSQLICFLFGYRTVKILISEASMKK